MGSVQKNQRTGRSERRRFGLDTTNGHYRCVKDKPAHASKLLKAFSKPILSLNII